MNIEQGQSPDRRERSVSFEELVTLISALGTDEAHAITFLLLGRRAGVSRGGLHDRFVASQGQTVWNLHKYTLSNHCERMLIPKGFVERRPPNPDDIQSGYTYAWTLYGERQGVPFVGLMVRMSEKYRYSLGDTWGLAHSPVKPITIALPQGEVEYRKTPQAVRLKIFEALTSLPLPLRRQKLVDHIGEEKSVVENNLRELSRKRIIMYRASDSDTPLRQFQLATQPSMALFTPYKGDPSLSTELYQLFLKNPRRQWTREQLADAITASNPDRNALNREALLVRIGKATSYLIEEKFVEMEDNEHRPISLTLQQKAFINDLMGILQAFQRQDGTLLAEARHIAFGVLANPTRIARLVQKAKDASKHAHEIPLGITEEQILTLFKEGTRLTVGKIEELFFYDFGRQLSRKRIGVVLEGLKKNGKVNCLEGEGTTYWFAVKKDNQTVGSFQHYRHGKQFFERKIRIMRLWRFRRREEALAVTNIRDAFTIYQLLEQQDPQLSYREIEMRVGTGRRWIKEIAERFVELGIPITRLTKTEEREEQLA